MMSGNEKSKSSFRGRIRRAGRQVKKVTVDLSNRLQRSFGTPVSQKVEVYYRGKPMTFNYTGPIESVSVDVVKRKLGDEEDVPMKFDATRRRMDMSSVYLTCSCGYVFPKISMPTVATEDLDSILKEALKDKDVSKHNVEGHTLYLKNVETPVEVIPENERIKNFSDQRVNYYRLFSKRTAEVKYLASYGQDILAEAPQYKYLDTNEGKKNLGLQNTLFMFFIFGLIELLTYIASSSQATYYYSPVVRPNLTPWYILIAVVIVMVIVMWRVHLYDLSQTMVKVVELQSGPFFINNRGVLPVVMTNSVLTQMWDFQAKVMGTSDVNARDIYYSIQMWSDQQIGLLYRQNKLGELENELSNINNDIRDLIRLDHDFKREHDLQSSPRKYLLYGVLATILGYSMVLYFIGIF